MSSGITHNRVTGPDRAAWRTPTMRQDIVRRYVDGKQPMRRIAAELGCAYSTVNKVLSLEQVPKRPRGGAHGTAGKDQPTRRPQADELPRREVE